MGLFVIFVNEIMFSVALVCLFVFLSICLLAMLLKKDNFLGYYVVENTVIF